MVVEGRARGVCVTVMYCGEEEKQWTCGKAGAANLRKVSSIVRDIGDPCLSQSPVKVVVTVRLQQLYRVLLIALLMLEFNSSFLHHHTHALLVLI